MFVRVAVVAFLAVVATQVLGACSSKPARRDAGPHQPSPGTVTISSQPSGAAVFRDQHERLGRTPLTLHKPGGSRLNLVLVKDAHEPRQVTAAFDSGRHIKLEVTLTPKQSEVIVSSIPATGAEIFVDGVPEGRTPNRIHVDADTEHLVEVRKPNFESYQEKVKLRVGESQRVIALLQRQGRHIPMGTLVLRVNAPAEVYLDGRFVGHTPLPPLPLAARPHRLRIKAQSGEEEHRRVMVEKGQRLELSIAMGHRTTKKDR